MLYSDPETHPMRLQLYWSAPVKVHLTDLTLEMYRACVYHNVNVTADVDLYASFRFIIPIRNLASFSLYCRSAAQIYRKKPTYLNPFA